MSNVYQDHAAMLDDLYVEVSEPALVFKWNSADWKILPGGARFSRKNDTGGFALDSDLQLTATVAQFGAEWPQAAETIAYQGKDYTIESVMPAPGSAQIRINANLNVKGM